MLTSERADLVQTRQELWERQLQVRYDDPVLKDLREDDRRIVERQRQIDEQVSELFEQRRIAADLELRTFTRPTKSIAGLLSRRLGPLPDPSLLIQPTAKNLAKVRSFRWPALGLMIVAIGVLITLVVLFPWMRISPATVITSGFKMWFGDVAGSIVSTVVITLLFLFLPTGIALKRYRGKFLDQLAMYEEQWFRTGAETWTIRQRIYSCVAFGLVHVVNIIYPIASILVVGAVGGVFMWVYLRTFKKTQSVKLATLASAKLHASYNRFAFLYLFAAIAVSIGYGVVTSLSS